MSVFISDPWLCGVDVSNNTCVDDDLYSIACLPPNYPMPAPISFHDWYSNHDGYWHCNEDERLWRLERTLWAMGY